MRVLIADDDKMLSQFLGEIVRGAGHEAVAAFDAMQTFMFAMRAPQPDLVLLDINMPAGTGREALRKIKASAKTAHIPVVVVSSQSDDETRAEVTALGAVRFIPKPIDPEAVLAVLANPKGGGAAPQP